MKISEVERAVLHAGLCYLERHAREIGNVIELKYVAELRAKLYPELAKHGQDTDRTPTQEKQEVQSPGPQPQRPAQSQAPVNIGFKPSLPPLNSYQQQSAENAQPAPRRMASGGTPIISEKQSKRLYAIQMKSGKKQYEVKEYLKRMGFTSSKDITVDKYEEIINWVQS